MVIGTAACLPIEAARLSFDIEEPSTTEMAQQRDRQQAFRSKEFDRDGDGAFDQQEWAERNWAFFLTGDRSGDAVLDFAEYIVFSCGLRVEWEEFYTHCRRFHNRRFLILAGADRVISYDDARREWSRVHRRLDTNRDGLVSPSETSVSARRR